MVKLIIVVGLPGAGKSYYLDSNAEVRSLASDHVVRDFHSGAIWDLPAPEMSQHFQRLVIALDQGEDCAIADVAFCNADRLEALKRAFQACVSDVEFDVRYFANDADACKHNIQHDLAASGRTDDRRLELLDELATAYAPPTSMDVERAGS